MATGDVRIASLTLSSSFSCHYARQIAYAIRDKTSCLSSRSTQYPSQIKQVISVAYSFITANVRWPQGRTHERQFNSIALKYKK